MADRRVRASLAVVAAIAALLSGCTPGPAAAPSATATAATPVLAAAEPEAPVFPTGEPAALVFPETGQGAVGLASSDGSVQLLGQSPDASAEPVPIASITKVITSLVVLDAHPLATPDDPGPTITLGQADLDITAEVEAADQFTEPMYAGQQVSLRDALAVTLLTSANNYAETAARWAFGSQEAFLAAARSWLDEHGLTSTTLADASGLDPGSASTPAELLRIAALAHADPALAAIAGTASMTQADLGTIANQNVLLGENGVDGLKTGSTSYAGFTLLTSAERTVASTPVTLVSVVLGTPSLDARFVDTRALLASAEAGLVEITLAEPGQVMGRYRSTSGETVEVVSTDARSAVALTGTPVTAEVELEPLSEGAAGEVVGTARFTLGSTTLEVPLALAGPLTPSP